MNSCTPGWIVDLSGNAEGPHSYLLMRAKRDLLIGLSLYHETHRNERCGRNVTSSHQKVRRDESVRLVDPALAVFLVVVGWFGLNADARSRGQLQAKPC